MIRRSGCRIGNGTILCAELVVDEEFVDAGGGVGEGAGKVLEGDGCWGYCEGSGGEEGEEGGGELHCDVFCNECGLLVW
jgi:hypothetical protein